MKIKGNSKGLRFRKKSKKKLYIFYGICVLAAIIALFVMIGTNEEVPQQSSPVQEPVVSESAIEIAQENNPMNDLSPEAQEELRIRTSVEEKLLQMSTEEKVAQLFMITPEALTGYGAVTSAGDVTRKALEKYPIGGIALFDSNIVSPTQLKEMNAGMQSYSKEVSGVPLFIAIDEEGGQITRIAKKSSFKATRFENMSQIGSAGDVERAREVGLTIGAYLKEYGINVDFAPVADVVTNPKNTVVSKRAFGSDPDAVANMSNAVIDGLKENGIYSCLKHFPGHGGTVGDTHKGYAYTERNMVQINESELVPFRKGIENGAEFVMVAHIAAPNITGDETPASVSQYMVTGILRKQLGFEGIVITDAMNMGAIIDEYSADTAAVKAINAGVDMILMPEDFKLAYNGVLNAVKSGEISEQRLNESVSRILKAKYSMK